MSTPMKQKFPQGPFLFLKTNLLTAPWGLSEMIAAKNPSYFKLSRPVAR